MIFEDMDREELKARARRFHKGRLLLNEFFDAIGGLNAGSDQLNLLIETYVANAQVSQMDLANMVSFVNQVKKVFFQSSALYSEVQADEAAKVPGFKAMFDEVGISDIVQATAIEKLSEN